MPNNTFLIHEERVFVRIQKSHTNGRFLETRFLDGISFEFKQVLEVKK